MVLKLEWWWWWVTHTADACLKVSTWADKEMRTARHNEKTARKAVSYMMRYFYDDIRI
jgi:hypothetical protein